MNVAIDTNVLVRFILADDEGQYQSAVQLLNEAKSVTVSSLILCEMVWVLKSCKIARKDIIEQITGIAQTEKIIVADDEVQAGLAVMKAGGDFADGVAAYSGCRLSPGGNAAFASFDKAAVRLLSQQGYSAFVPA